MTQSDVTHHYERILKRLEEDRKLKKEWEEELNSIMSMFKG